MILTPKKNIYKNIKGKGKIKRFTKGKYYTVIVGRTNYKNLSEFNDFYEIVNDFYETEIITKTSLFQTVSQKRDKTLNEILNN